LALQSNGSTGLTLDTALNVGIGTASPSYKLDVTNASDATLLQVKSTANANNTAMRIGIDGNNSFINATGGSTGALQLRTYGTTQATLDASGNLGLGVTPTAGVGDTKHIELPGGGVFRSKDVNVDLGANYYYDSAYKYIVTGAATRFEQNSGAYKWYSAASGTAGNAITFTQAMTLDASGNLGLGATTISSIGSGYTTMQFSGSTGSGVRFYRGATSSTLLYGDSNGFYLQLQENLPMFFWTNNTERFRIAGNGAWGLAGANYGTSGQVLTSGGSGAAPSWSTPAGVSVFTGSFTRDLTTASGSQAITGVGFVPKAVLFTMSVGGGARFSDGFDTQTARGSTYTNGSATFNADARSIVALTSGSDFQYAQIATMDSDGFTLTWTKTGSPTGSATIKYLAIG
jgi:hypothetical protein